MKKYIIFLLCPVFLAFFAVPASATYLADITYDYTDNGGGNYTFTFDVANNSTGSDTGGLDFFEILFDATTSVYDFSGMTWVSDNSWSTLAGDPFFNFGFNEPGFANADDAAIFGGSGGIAQGASLGGFSVDLAYSGSLALDSLAFSFFAEFGTFIGEGQGGIDIYDCDLNYSYSILGDFAGTVTYGGGDVPSVPEPGTILLLGTGLIGLSGVGRKKFIKS